MFPARELPEPDGKSLHMRLGLAFSKVFMPVCFSMEGYIYQETMAKIILGIIIQYSWFATSDILTTL